MATNHQQNVISKLLVYLCLYLISYCTAFVHHASFATGRRSTTLFLSSEDDKRRYDDTDDDNSFDHHHPMAHTSRLSHTMLKVPSVDETAAYWENKGGYILRSTKAEDGHFLSAFCALGNNSNMTSNQTPSLFSLELIEMNSNAVFQLGNALAYISVSTLLAGPIMQQSQQGDDDDEPNGICVKSVVASTDVAHHHPPGGDDAFLARLAFQTNNLAATRAFYTELLGMESSIAADASQICLRYKTPTSLESDDDSSLLYNGTPTTLVFEATNENIVLGTCFDHLVICTRADIDKQYERIKQAGGGAGVQIVYMKPVDMFGSRIMGVKDPNGYRVILASEPESS